MSESQIERLDDAPEGASGCEPPSAAARGIRPDEDGVDAASSDPGTRENSSGSSSPEPAKRNLSRGLYGKINISVKTLDKIIAVLIVLLIAALVLAMSDRGFTVTFDTLGGTAVESQTLMYGDLVEMEEEPTREGYVFDGWYTDRNCTYAWDIETDTVSESMTLYAGWSEDDGAGEPAAQTGDAPSAEE